MARIMTTRSCRRGQVHASTVFAVIMAIVAGLIGAWFFKVYMLTKPVAEKPAPPPAPPLKKLTVAAVNLLDKTQIISGGLKTINVTDEEFERRVPQAKLANLLQGNQPLFRIPKKPIKAEMPIFEDDLEELQYPEPVSVRLAPGKRAVIMEIPASQAMVQVNDRVDVLCTLSYDNVGFQGGDTGTAAIAKGLKVVARFGSTRSSARPNAGEKRTYTLEASPYRASILELAKSVGGTFNLLVSPRLKGADGAAAMALDDMGMNEPQTDTVSKEDLAKLFGVKPVQPIPTWEVERYSGVNKDASIVFQGYSNPGQKSGKTSTPATAPSAPKPPPVKKTTSALQSASGKAPIIRVIPNTENLVASSSETAGAGSAFRAPVNLRPCCGKK